MIHHWFLLSFAIALIPYPIAALFESVQFLKVPRPCDHVCVGGGCLFENCTTPASCPGGACDFVSCVEPSCSGGACKFTDSEKAHCSGGSCNFEIPRDTLRPGYCKGENCYLDGESHPSFEGGYHTA